MSFESHINYLLSRSFLAPLSNAKNIVLCICIEYDLDTMTIVNTYKLINYFRIEKNETKSFFKLYDKDQYNYINYTFVARVDNNYLQYNISQEEYRYINYQDGRSHRLLITMVDDEKLSKFKTIVNSYITLNELKG